jgi:hypothetical protein
MKFIPFAALAAASLLIFDFSPAQSLACACGCGVFDVGDGTFMPADSQSNGEVWFRYDYMDQNQNWEGDHKAPASDNQDKQINTSFYTVGGQYMVNRHWTVMAELPIFDRALTTTDDGTVFGPAGSVYTGHIFAQGDLQLTGVYTGLSPDMSTGLSLGVKLPTGNFTGPRGPLGGLEFDRDSLPGTGSTDLMVGGYHVGHLNTAGTLSYFVQARYQFAVATQDGYRPGNEFDSVVGLSYDFGAVGPVSKVAPFVQLVNSYRERDGGPEADPLNSGYERLLFSPGVEVRIKRVRILANVELPIYQDTNAAASLATEDTSGQLVASTLVKVQFGYDF